MTQTTAITTAVRRLAGVSIVSPDVALYRPLAEIVQATIAAAAGNSAHTQRAYKTAIGQFILWLNETQGHRAEALRPFVALQDSGSGRNRRVMWDYGNTPAAVLRLVDRAVLDAWRAKLVEDGASVNTAAVRVLTVQTFLRVALRDGVLTGEQAANIGLSPFKAKLKRDIKPVGRRMSAEEVRKLLAQINTKTNKGKRDYAILAVLLYAGLRREECATLTPTLFDFDHGKRYLRLMGKGNKTRRVEVHSTLERALQHWMEAAKIAWADDTPLFRSVNRGDRVQAAQIDPNVIERVLSEYARAAGIGDVEPHDLRRTFARRLHDGGRSLAEIQQLLGHASPATTAHYVGLADEGSVEGLSYEE